MRLNRTVAIVLVVLVGLIAWAWIAGGAQPQHLIEVPVSLPDAGR